MFIEILLIILTLVAIGSYLLYYAPKKKIENFINQAKSQGYRVKVIPFHPFKYYMVGFQEEYNRSLKTFKEQIPGKYDFIVGNIFSTMAIIPVSTELQKDFYNSLSKLPKNPFITEVYTKLLNGGGLLFTQGEISKRKRRIMSSVFHYDFINDIVPIIQGQIDYYLKEIDQAIDRKNTINIQVLAVKILCSIIAKSFFGTDMNDQQIEGKAYSDYFLQYLEEANQFTMSPEHAFLGMLGPKYGLTARCRQVVRKFKIIRQVTKQICLKELEKLKTNKQIPKNLLTTLYQSKILSFDQNQNPDQYSLDELMGQFFTFVGAGTDSSSHAINLILHYLSEYPNYLEKVREQFKIINQQKNLTNGERIKKMIWIDAIFNQVLRINGPISEIIPRISIDEITLGKIKVPKGTSFNVLPLINHYNPEYFQQPEKFIPERWMNDPKIQPFSFTPFAAGERNCMGQYLARVEVKMILSKLVEKYEFKSLHPIEMKKKFFFITQNSEFNFQKKLEKQKKIEQRK